MKNALIAVIAVCVAFSVGMAGVYFAMPTLAPERVQEAQARLDSLAVVDSLARLFEEQALPDSIGSLPEVIAAVFAARDSAETTEITETTPDTATAEPPVAEQGDEMLPTMSPQDQNALQDSLLIVQERVAALMQERATFLAQIEALREQLNQRQLQRAEVQELSTTLTKLEDRELSGVVAQLDGSVLEALFMEASTRNRTRLLQAMPAELAAQFVQRLVQPNVAASDVSVEPDSMRTMETANGDTEPLNR